MSRYNGNLEKCNGFKNWYTFAVAVWLDNDQSLYDLCQEWKNNVINKVPGYKKTYKNFLYNTGLDGCYTPDNFSMNCRYIAKKEIIEDIFND